MISEIFFQRTWGRLDVGRNSNETRLVGSQELCKEGDRSMGSVSSSLYFNMLAIFHNNELSKAFCS